MRTEYVGHLRIIKAKMQIRNCVTTSRSSMMKNMTTRAIATILKTTDWKNTSTYLIPAVVQVRYIMPFFVVTHATTVTSSHTVVDFYGVQIHFWWNNVGYISHKCGSYNFAQNWKMFILYVIPYIIRIDRYSGFFFLFSSHRPLNKMKNDSHVIDSWCQINDNHIMASRRLHKS